MGNFLYEFHNVSNDRVKEIDLTIKEKERVVIFGPSGAGKSSLLFLFNRLQTPHSGSIKYKNRSIEEYKVEELRKEAGLVLQEANLFPGTVLENIRFGPDLFGEWEEGRAEELMEIVQLPADYLHKEADQLSGGEQQRVSIARTLANRPMALLLDEPTSALDGKTSEEIEKLFVNLVENHENTMIWVTHNLSQAKRVGETGWFMENGRLVEKGTLADMLENPETEELKAFLERNL